MALGSDQRSAEGDLEVDFPLHARRWVGKGREQLQRLAEVADRFRQRRALTRPPPRLVPVFDRLLGEPRLRAVVRQKFWLHVRRLRESLLEDARDAGVQLLAAGLEQRLIGGVLDQRVLEAVGGLGRRAAAEHQLGCDQLVEGGAQLVLGPVGDRGEQLVGELAADHGADLGHLLDRREAIEPGHQRVVQGRRDRERRQRAGQLVAVARVR